MILAIVTNTLIIGALANSVDAQTPTIQDLPMTTIKQTNSTLAVLNKTLPAENESDVVPVVPM